MVRSMRSLERTERQLICIPCAFSATLLTTFGGVIAEIGVQEHWILEGQGYPRGRRPPFYCGGRATRWVTCVPGKDPRVRYS